MHLSAIFTGLYVALLERGVGLLEHLKGLSTVSTPSLLGQETLCSMGMIIRRGSWFILASGPTEQQPGGKESDDESDNISSLPLATEPIGPSSFTTVHPR